MPGSQAAAATPIRDPKSLPREWLLEYALAEITIDVYSLNAIGVRLYKAHIGQVTITDRKIISELIREAASTVGGHKFGPDYRVVYFATHGLLAGEVKGLGEPALALTLPAKPSDLDDGLLTASEVAQLKLNSDWVVLSACNTAAGDKPGAEALSGLARAFFYAGARALLVSHWAVDSDAATRLTTETFDVLRKDPNLGRAEALRRAMLAYMNDTTDPLSAYPALWAPFVVVGEGAAR
jgi:CHAT domain-containing protein